MGTASHEVAQSNEDENKRAGKRAKKIVECLRPNVGKAKLYKLNLGKYKGQKKESELERKVIVIGILKSKIKLTNAVLQNQMDKIAPELGIRPSEYSLFDYTENDPDF